MRTLILALSISVLSTSATADWCVGKKWLFAPMTMKERVEAASKNLEQLVTEIDRETHRLKTDVKANSQSLRQQLKQQHQQLGTQTVQLCQTAKNSQFPLNYQQIELETALDYQQQLQLNLRLIRSQQHIMHLLKQEESSFENHLKQLNSYRREMVLLRQQTLVWQRSPVSSLQFVQQACALKENTEDELEASQDIIIHEVLDDKLDQMDQESIEPSVITHFSKYCKLSILQQQMSSKNTWWGALQ